MQEKISLSEGSTVDLRKPGEELDNFSELAEESMEPEECFPECESLNIAALLISMLQNFFTTPVSSFASSFLLSLCQTLSLL